MHSAVLCERYEFGVPRGGAGAAAHCCYGHYAEEWGQVSTVVVVGVVVLVVFVVAVVSSSRGSSDGILMLSPLCSVIASLLDYIYIYIYIYMQIYYL